MVDVGLNSCAPAAAAAGADGLNSSTCREATSLHLPSMMSWISLTFIYASMCALLFLVVALRFHAAWTQRRSRRIHPLPAAGPLSGAALDLARHAAASPLLLESATSLARLVRTRSVTSAELCDVFIAQILRVNPHLGAAVGYRFDEARAEAAEADRVTAASHALGAAAVARLPTFHGVPCSVKECFALSGMRQTAGLAALADHIPAADATAVARMRAAGLIPLAVTNVSELCMWMESNNTIYGRTHNPFALDRTVGGSSGGEAAIVSALGAPLGLGSDVGGSIRMPAFFCGIYGHKPSGGAVPNTGGLPTARGRIQRYCQPGPLCRRAEDLFPLLRVLHGPDGVDSECGHAFPQTPTREEEAASCSSASGPAYAPAVPPSLAASSPLVLRDPAAFSLARTRIHVLDCRRSFGSHFLLSPVDARIERSISEAAHSLCTPVAGGSTNCCVEVVPLVLPELREAFDIWSSMMGRAQSTPFRQLLGQAGLGAPWELFKCLLGLGGGRHTLPALLLALLERVTECMPGRARALEARGEALKLRFAQAVGASDVMLVPPHPVLAPRHDWPLNSLKFMNCSYTCIFNVLELPVSSVPLGLCDAVGSDNARLPLGVQVVANYGQDHVALAVALALDARFGGWRPPVVA